MNVIAQRLRRSSVAAASALATVLLLSGCLRFTADLEVSQENTVTGEYVVAVPTGTGESLGMSDKDVATELWGDTEIGDGLSNATIDGYRDGGWSGIVVRLTDEPLSAFAPTADHWGITRQGETFVVSGVMSGSALSAGEAEAGQTPPDVKVSLTFPGAVTSANGEVTGRTVTWIITQENTSLSATADAQPTPDRARTLAFLVATILAGAGIAYWWAGRVGQARRRGAPAGGTIRE